MKTVNITVCKSIKILKLYQLKLGDVVEIIVTVLLWIFSKIDT